MGIDEYDFESIPEPTTPFSNNHRERREAREEKYPNAPFLPCRQCQCGSMWPYRACKIAYGHRQTAWMHRCQTCGKEVYVFECWKCGEISTSEEAEQSRNAEGYICSNRDCNAALPPGKEVSPLQRRSPDVRPITAPPTP